MHNANSPMLLILSDLVFIIHIISFDLSKFIDTKCGVETAGYL